MKGSTNGLKKSKKSISDMEIYDIGDTKVSAMNSSYLRDSKTIISNPIPKSVYVNSEISIPTLYDLRVNYILCIF